MIETRKERISEKEYYDYRELSFYLLGILIGFDLGCLIILNLSQ